MIATAVALRALYVGRFQPFHLGHLRAIEYMLSKTDELVVVVGSAQYSHTKEDPFTAGERVTMIRLALNEVGIDLTRYYVIPVPDLNIHDIWVSHVVSYVPKFEEVYSNEPLTSRLFLEDGRFKVKPIPYQNRQVYSATEIRNRVLNREEWEDLVPKSVVRFIREIHGEERLLDVVRTDKVP
jgi:nicotinamide-nucleotide adenylyltransferase